MAETVPVNFWCHQCQEEIHPMYVPNPACPNCHGDFVELIEEENDPRGFFAPEGNTEDDEEEDTQNPSLPALILSILQSVHRSENLNQPLEGEDYSDPEGELTDSVPASPNSRLASPSGNNLGGERSVRDNRTGSSLRQLLADIFSNQFSTPQTESQSSNSNNGGLGSESGIQLNGRNLDRMDGLYTAPFTRSYVTSEPMASETTSAASRSIGHTPSELNGIDGADAANPRQSFFRQLFTTLASGSDLEQDDAAPFTITTRDGRYSLTASFANGEEAPNSRLSPFLQLITGMTGNPGDYALGPNALDNIITQLMEQTSSANAPPPASKETIEKIPSENISILEINAHEECAVCKEEFVLDEKVRLLPCKHRYHSDCIVPWLTRNGTCPVCRFSFHEPDVAQAHSEYPEDTSQDPGSAISLD